MTKENPFKKLRERIDLKGLGEKARKWKHVLVLLVQIILLILLLVTLNASGMSLLMGEGFGRVATTVIEFGIVIMTLFGSFVSLFYPTEQHRTLRDTQVQLFKYMTILGLFQVLAIMLSQVTGSISASSSTTIHPIFMSVMVMLYCMNAFMMPFNYVKNLFNIMKSVEKRNPNRIVEEYFR